MKKKAFAAMLAALFTANVQANTVGLYLGGQIWQSEASGMFGEENTLIDFNLKKEQQINYFVAVEHPFPLLPNARIAASTLDTTGKTSLTQAFNFGDETFASDDDVDASFNVSYVDYTLYYQLVDNDLFSFDLGLTARVFDGAVTVTRGTTSDYDEYCYGAEPVVCITTISFVTPADKRKTNDIEPMLYVATNISLPLTNLSVFAQADYFFKNTHSLYDYQVGLSYDLVDSRKVDFNLTLGYRTIKMELGGLNNLYTDLEFKGAFAGVIAHF